MAILQQFSLISPISPSLDWGSHFSASPGDWVTPCFLTSSEAFASYISDEAGSLLAPLCSDLFLISTLGPLLPEPQKVISVAGSNLAAGLGADARAEHCTSARHQHPWELGAGSTRPALGKRSAGCSRTRCCKGSKPPEGGQGAGGGKLDAFFDELAADFAQRTVVFTVHKICAGSQNCKLYLNMSQSSQNMSFHNELPHGMAWYVLSPLFSHPTTRDNSVSTAW